MPAKTGLHFIPCPLSASRSGVTDTIRATVRHRRKIPHLVDANNRFAFRQNVAIHRSTTAGFERINGTV